MFEILSEEELGQCEKPMAITQSEICSYKQADEGQIIPGHFQQGQGGIIAAI